MFVSDLEWLSAVQKQSGKRRIKKTNTKTKIENEKEKKPQTQKKINERNERTNGKQLWC